MSGGVSPAVAITLTAAGRCPQRQRTAAAAPSPPELASACSSPSAQPPPWAHFQRPLLRPCLRPPWPRHGLRPERPPPSQDRHRDHPMVRPRRARRRSRPPSSWERFQCIFVCHQRALEPGSVPQTRTRPGNRSPNARRGADACHPARWQRSSCLAYDERSELERPRAVTRQAAPWA